MAPEKHGSGLGMGYPSCDFKVNPGSNNINNFHSTYVISECNVYKQHVI